MTAGFVLFYMLMLYGILLDSYILASYVLLFYEMCGVPKQMMWKNPWNLHIFRFYDITHETVVMPATDFGIPRKCSINLFGSSDTTFFLHLFA